MHEREPIDIVCRARDELLLTYFEASVVSRVDLTTGAITTVAGTGEPGYTGDGGPATAARLNYPVAVAVDGQGHVFIADSNNFAVRRVDAKTGVITTVAGTGEPGYTGDGGLAIAARLNEVGGLGFNRADDLFVADLENCVVRRIDANTGVISTVAGTGEPGYTGDGGPATAARLQYPQAVAIDHQGNVFVADAYSSVVRRVDAGTRVITTFAGTGERRYSGDGGPASAARLNQPTGLAFSRADDLFITDLRACVVRRVDATTGVITTVAGTGKRGHTGDGGPATAARLNSPNDIALNDGILYVAEIGRGTSNL